MKQPWEVYLESFRYGAPNLNPGAPWNEIRERGDEILEGALKARESLLYHLVQAERWKVADAAALAREFIVTTVGWMKKEDKDPSARIEDALRNQWTDWVLRHK